MRATNSQAANLNLNLINTSPAPTSLRAALWDINGVLRGKRLPATSLSKLDRGGLRMPLSIAGMDIWGADIADNPAVFASGDADGLCEPTGRGPVPLPWLSHPTSLVPVWLREEGGAPYLGDPRRVLAHVLERYHKRGWRPVVATELEFYLVARTPAGIAPAASPVTGRTANGPGAMAMAEIDDFSGFIEEVFAAGELQGLALDAAISENGAGQFEINLMHSDDALRAADDALLFKLLVKGIARKHGFEATFMAKPFAGMAGSGLHVHFSLIDEAGCNLFDDGGPLGSDLLRNAVAGLQAHMVDQTPIFAPHFNSYKRLQPNTYAPVRANWGYENRMTALRVPGGPAVARRIEHRVSGADANPYLVLAAILAAAFDGIERALMPTKPASAAGPADPVAELPAEWRGAIEGFAASTAMAEMFPAQFRECFLAVKRQELTTFATRITSFERETYLAGA